MFLRNFSVSCDSLGFLLLSLSVFPLLATSTVNLPILHGMYINDLYTDVADQALLANLWTVSGLPAGSNKYDVCNTWHGMIGGIGKLAQNGYFERTYTGLPAHTAVYYALYFIVIDSWSSTDAFTIQIDGNLISTEYPSAAITATGAALCGSSSDPDTHYQALGRISHSGSSLTLKITSLVHPYSGSLGLKNVRITLASPASLVPANCAFYNSTKYNTQSTCPCKSLGHMSGGSCVNCHPSCQFCFGGTDKDCYSCTVGYFWDGVQCSSNCPSSNCLFCDPTTQKCDVCKTGYILRDDGTCQASCAAGSLPQTTGTFQFCEPIPCTGATPYVNFDNTCVACVLPYIKNDTNKLCLRPCPTTEFLYTNGTCKTACDYNQIPYSGYTSCDPCASGGFKYSNASCLPTCDSYMLPIIDGDYKFCRYPCNPATQFLYSNGSCLTSCAFNQRLEGGYRFCNPCDSGYFKYSNGSCLSECNLPMLQNILGDYKYCIYPCNPNIVEYIYQSGVCLSTCNFTARIEGFYKFCDPCPNGYYRYENKTCLPSCAPSMKHEYEVNYPVCNYPCNTQLTEYLYTNSSCLSTCSFVTRNESSYKFCDPCPANHFRYPNSTCIPACKAPRKPRIQGQYQTCDNPCDDPTQFYYFNSAKCEKKCNYPYRIEDIVFCVLDMSEEEKETLDTIRSALDKTEVVTSKMALVSSLFSFSNPASLFLFALSDLFEYLRYISITYPPKVQYLFDSQPPNTDLVGFIPNMPASLAQKFERHTLPENFEKYKLNSNFLVNFWEQLASLALAFVTLMVVLALEKYSKSHKKLHIIFRSIKKALKWNFLVTLFISYYGPLSFFTSLEILSVRFDTLPSIVSFVCCVLVNLLALALFVVIVLILKDLWPKKSTAPRSQQINQARKKWKGYEMVFDSYKNKSMFHMLFLPFYIVRIYFFNVIVGYFYNYPTIQAIFLTVSSVLMWLYIILGRPFNHKLDFVEFFLEEGFILAINICTGILAIFDYLEADEFERRGALGEAMIICNLAANGVMTLYLFIGTLRSIVNLYRFLRRLFQKINSAQTKKRGRLNSELQAALSESNKPIETESATYTEQLSQRGKVYRNRNQSLSKDLTMYTNDVSNTLEDSIEFSTNSDRKRPRIRKYDSEFSLFRKRASMLSRGTTCVESNKSIETEQMSPLELTQRPKTNRKMKQSASEDIILNTNDFRLESSMDITTHSDLIPRPKIRKYTSEFNRSKTRPSIVSQGFNDNQEENLESEQIEQSHQVLEVPDQSRAQKKKSQNKKKKVRF